MPKTILCATDLSTRSGPALAAAGAIADRFEAPAVWLLHAIDAAHNTESYELPEVLDDLLEREIAKLSSLTSAAVQSMALYGSAPHALREFADRQAADLLVVASRGHGDTPLRRIGGMSEALSELNGTPLLVVRDEAPFLAWRDGKRPLRIVCGASHGHSWLAGLEWVRKLRQAGPCDVTLAQVYYAGEERARLGLAPGHSLTGSDPEVEAHLIRELQPKLREMGGRGELNIRLKAGIGRIGDHLLEVAKTENADMIVVGDNHHQGLGRLSSVASVTLHYANASVLLVPGELSLSLPVERPQRALVATDLEPVSNRALAHAYAILPASGQVTLLHVARDAEADLEAIRQSMEALVPAFRERQTKIQIERGVDVAPAICAAAEREDVDLLCLVSSRRLTRALGSVPDKVMRHTTRPVLLVSGDVPK